MNSAAREATDISADSLAKGLFYFFCIVSGILAIILIVACVDEVHAYRNPVINAGIVDVQEVTVSTRDCDSLQEQTQNFYKVIFDRPVYIRTRPLQRRVDATSSTGLLYPIESGLDKVRTAANEGKSQWGYLSLTSVCLMENNKLVELPVLTQLVPK